MSDPRRVRAIRRGGAVLAASGALAAIGGGAGVAPSPALSGALVGVAAVALVGAVAFDAPALGPVWLCAALFAGVALVASTADGLLGAGAGLALVGAALWGGTVLSLRG